MLGVVSPQLEIGSFEALWAKEGVSSFKQLRDKFKDKNVQLASELVERDIALDFYRETLKHLNNSGVQRFGVRIEGTFDYPEKLQDADHPLFLWRLYPPWGIQI